MPTTKKTKETILEIISKEPPGKIYELGSGWGTLAIPVARQHSDCSVLGFEISPIPYYCSKIGAKLSGLKNVSFHRTDFFHVSLKDASIVVCYLFPVAMERLKSKFEKELQEGALVISNTFAVPGWTPRRTVVIDDLYKTKVYLYKC